MGAPGFQSARSAGWCSRCGAQLGESCRFCMFCGTPVIPMLWHPIPDSSHKPTAPHHGVWRGFSQIFGLHPAVAFLTFIVDAMLFGEEGLATVIGLPTGGTSLVASLMISSCAGAFVGFIAYMAQMKWYGDDKESARIKAIILGFLTAIPTALPAFIYVPAGIVGFFRRKTDN